MRFAGNVFCYVAHRLLKPSDLFRDFTNPIQMNNEAL